VTRSPEKPLQHVAADIAMAAVDIEQHRATLAARVLALLSGQQEAEAKTRGTCALAEASPPEVDR